MSVTLRPSAVVSTGISAVTVALSVASGATDAVPLAKQILTSAAHISAAAERLQRKRESMYLLVEKADIYATQIDIAVAGRLLDTSHQRRLERLYTVFLKIETLVDATVSSKSRTLKQLWRSIVTDPIRAETLLVELEREIQLFQLLTGIQLSFAVENTAHVVDDTARVVAKNVMYDDQFRVLRDCDVEKLDVITEHETDGGVVVWASARVDGQLMVIRYVDPVLRTSDNDQVAPRDLGYPTVPYHEYLRHIRTLSMVHTSHRNIVQLYGHHFQGPERRFSAFRSGTWDLYDVLDSRGVPPPERYEEEGLYRLRVAYKILDASSHLLDAHGLTWAGSSAIVDETGEPRIGLFDDIVRADSQQLHYSALQMYFVILFWYSHQWTAELEVVEKVHAYGSSIQDMVTLLASHLSVRSIL